MMAAKFYYCVIAKLIKKKNSAGEYESIDINREFQNEELINSRHEALKYYQSLIEVLLQSRGLEYETDRQAREALDSFIDPKTNTKFVFDDESYEISDSLGNGIGVILIGKDDEKHLVHGIGELQEGSTTPEGLTLGLEEEYGIFKENHFDTGGIETTIMFCNREEWLDGYRDDEPQSYTFLETPFDWSGMDKPYWWGEPIEEQKKEEPAKSKSFEEIIEGGESLQVEFKPTLLYNFTTKQASIGIKGIIAKTICAFLNSQGGFLFIGMHDSGQPQGLSYDFSLAGEKNPKDYFNLEFDDMIRQFLPKSLKSNISGRFEKIKGQEIFVVVVRRSRKGPVFMNGQFEKEFWVRWTASTRQYKDIEEIANYCLEHWGEGGRKE